MPTIAALVAVGLGLTGCMTPHAYIREGDADGVSVAYAKDVAAAWPLARQHCAQFDRLPRLVNSGLDIAEFRCERR